MKAAVLSIRTGLSALAVLAVFAATPVPAPAEVFKPTTFTLDNGMQVVLVEDHRVPVVSHMVWYKVGAADEPPGKSGLAHLFEHLMFKGTKELEPGEFSRIVARHGGQENAFTSWDYTGYYQNVAVDRLETMMRWEADRMVNLTLTQEVIEPEKLVVLEERRQRTDSSPRALLFEAVTNALYQNHPYRIPVIGWAHEIAALQLEDFTSFYKRFYAPNNAILVVAGDITAEELRPLAEKYYGVLPRGPEVVRQRPAEPPQKAPRRVILRDEKVRQPAWMRVFQAPSYSPGEAGPPYALEVLAEILGETATSRLYRTLVVEEGIAVAASAGYSPDAVDTTRFTISASPQPQTSMEDLEAAMERVIANVLNEGVTAEEVERATRRLVAQAVYARDSFNTAARVLGQALAIGLSVEDVESWPQRIAAVTVEDVNAAARQVLREEASVTGLLLPPLNAAETAGHTGEQEVQQ